MPVTQVVIGTKTSGRTAWLAPGPAASYERMRRAGMPPGSITDAGRTRAEQQAMWDAYLRGELTATAARPGTSTHETGLALDIVTSSRVQAWLIAHGAEHGWSRPLLHAAKAEPWHWQYDLTRDRHLADAPLPPPIEEEIVTTLEELDAHLDARLTPIRAALAGQQRRWFKFEGSNLAWIDLGTCRRRGSDDQYDLDGKPEIGVLDPRDPFWALPILGDAWGELYRLPLSEDKSGDAWLLESPGGQIVRRWPGAPAYKRKGSPPIVTLQPDNPFWLLDPIRREGVA